MIAVLGIGPDPVQDGEILPLEERKKIVKVFLELVSIREALWSPDGHTEREIQALQHRIVSMMVLYKEAFQDYTSSKGFRFPKFHMTTHLTELITRFGSVRWCDSGPGERQHKTVVKPGFRKTSKKKRQVASELVEAVNTKVKLSLTCKKYGITVKQAGDNRQHTPRDGFSGERGTLTSLEFTRDTAAFINLPGELREQSFAFKRGLVVELLLQAGCDDRVAHKPADSLEGRKARKEFFRQYHPPVLYSSFSISTGGSSSVTYRASRSFHGRPWHDFLVCSVQEGEEMLEYAARALSFVSLVPRGEDATTGGKMFVFVEWFVSALGDNNKKRKRGAKKTVHDLRAKHPWLPLPYVHLEPVPNRRYDLIDTESVNGGLWVQKAFDSPGNYWVLRCEEHNK